MPNRPSTAAPVRPFEPGDRDSVLGLAPRLLIGMAPWRDPKAFLAATRGWIEGSIDGIGPDRAVLVAEDGHGRVLGFVSVAGASHLTGERQAHVGELAVAEDAEGRGAGRVLMEAAENWAHEHGYRLVVLETGAANDRARGFYARSGYAEEGVRLAKMLRDAADPRG